MACNEVLEKGSEPGAHMLSGAAMAPRPIIDRPQAVPQGPTGAEM